jgi:hypothetical protein
MKLFEAFMLVISKSIQIKLFQVKIKVKEKKREEKAGRACKNERKFLI